jgi:hypothetical protein
MSIKLGLEIIEGLIKLGFNFYTMLKQASGDEPIPTWQELLDKNKTLQDKIDAELIG